MGKKEKNKLPVNLQIKFENDVNKIYAGELLHGTVWMTLSEEIIVRNLYVEINGKVEQIWFNGYYSKNTHIDTERYLHEISYLIGGPKKATSGKFNFSPGTYKYWFQFNLPSNLPTSIECKYNGFIRYTANVRLVTTSLSYESSMHFPVIRPFDLNDFPKLKEPAVEQKSKIFNLCGFLCCFPSNPVEITVRIRKRGYVPGQTINIEISSNNGSLSLISEFKVELLKVVQQYSGIQKTIELVLFQKHTIVKRRLSGFSSNQVLHATIEVPPIPPTDFSCKFIKVKHEIRVTGMVSDCYRNPKVEVYVPIAIGTTAFHDTADEEPPSYESVVG